MKKNNGFTLIEMLTVVIILGIILVIAIPSLTNLIGNRGKELYNTQMDLMEDALDLYTLQNKGIFNSYSDDSCFILSYEKLKQEQDFKETDVFCEGDILIYKNQGDYRYEYNLTCKDKNDIKYSEQTNITNACIRLN